MSLGGELMTEKSDLSGQTADQLQQGMNKTIPRGPGETSKNDTSTVQAICTDQNVRPFDLEEQRKQNVVRVKIKIAN